MEGRDRSDGGHVEEKVVMREVWEWTDEGNWMWGDEEQRVGE